MAKNDLRTNPNMMNFSGDNINFAKPIPFNFPQHNAISTQLPDNLNLNVSIPEYEKNNNSIGGFVNNQMNLNNIPSHSLGFNINSSLNHQNPVFPNSNINMQNFQNVNNQMQFSPISNNIINPNENSGEMRIEKVNNLNNLNSKLLPSPIPLNFNPHPILPSINIFNNNIVPHPQIPVLPLADPNSHLFNLNIHYKGEVQHPVNQVLDLNIIEQRLENISSLPDTELNSSKRKINLNKF